MTLQEWIQADEKDYGLGMALYGKYCKNRILFQNLSRKPNPGKLENELLKAYKRELLKGTIEKPVKVPEEQLDKTPNEPLGDKKKEQLIAEPAPFRLKIVREGQDVKYEDLPEEIQKLWDANRDSYKEIRSLHEKLKLMEKATPEERQPLTSRIVELDDSIRKNWEEIDSWQPGKQEPKDKNPAAVEDQATLAHKRINANRKYISTNAKKLVGESDVKKAGKLRKKIQERVNELKAAGENLKGKTEEELKKLGIEC